MRPNEQQLAACDCAGIHKGPRESWDTLLLWWMVDNSRRARKWAPEESRRRNRRKDGLLGAYGRARGIAPWLAEGEGMLTERAGNREWDSEEQRACLSLLLISGWEWTKDSAASTSSILHPLLRSCAAPGVSALGIPAFVSAILAHTLLSHQQMFLRFQGHPNQFSVVLKVEPHRA